MSVSVDEILKNLILALQVSQRFGVAIRAVSEAVERANDEGRDLTPEEMQFFADSAREAVERI